jgi:lipoic acid synthetase
MKSTRIPSWLKRPSQAASSTNEVKRLLRTSNLNTVCEEARCPNISDCFSRGTATFMILGDVCTRGCRFCSVHTGKPLMASAGFKMEADNVATAAKTLGLRHVVVTSVARDDLEDGGASGFVETITSLKRELEGATVEVLIPDFRGNVSALQKVLNAKPDVLNHNLETVPRLYRKVRPGAKYQRSLDLLKIAKDYSGVTTKTGIMLGLGETDPEVLALFEDARKHSVDIFTAGQYMQPSKDHLPVESYVEPQKFSWYQSQAEKLGFKHVFIGPLVRSSYHADEFI